MARRPSPGRVVPRLSSFLPRPMTHELLTRDELAERFGVDVRTITNWVQAGMPQRTRSGKSIYSWPECRDWREEQIRKDGRANREAGGDEDIKRRRAEMKLRDEEIDLELREMELAERRGRSVPVDFMREEYARIATKLRTFLLSVPPAWAGRLGACETTVERQLVLEEAINDAMPILRELADDDGDDAGDAPSVEAA